MIHQVIPRSRRFLLKIFTEFRGQIGGAKYVSGQKLPGEELNYFVAKARFYYEYPAPSGLGG